MEDNDFNKGDEIVPIFHGGCTFVEVKPDKLITLGCDFLHAEDGVFENIDNPEYLMEYVNALNEYLEKEEEE